MYLMLVAETRPITGAMPAGAVLQLPAQRSALAQRHAPRVMSEICQLPQQRVNQVESRHAAHAPADEADNQTAHKRGNDLNLRAKRAQTIRRSMTQEGHAQSSTRTMRPQL